jgi:hypothetical protein
MKAPKNQVTEVLYMLLNGKKTTSDFKEIGILNSNARIANLREMGVNIICDDIKHTNKFGRNNTYGLFSILNKRDARKIYTQIN